jgi:hypothetical protein
LKIDDIDTYRIGRNFWRLRKNVLIAKGNDPDDGASYLTIFIVTEMNKKIAKRIKTLRIARSSASQHLTCKRSKWVSHFPASKNL